MLDYVAGGGFHALIDTGALITGMSNQQVAAYLLEHGLESEYSRGCCNASVAPLIVLVAGASQTWTGVCSWTAWTAR